MLDLFDQEPTTRCRKCRQRKAVSQFDQGHNNKPFQTCRECRAAYSRMIPCKVGATTKVCGGCKKFMAIEAFTWNGTKDGKRYRSSRCRECLSKRMSEWAKIPGNVKRQRIRRYGLSLEEYNALLASQNGRCAICGSTESKRKGKTQDLDVDHCHRTGRVRALLCSTCNNGLGCFKDDPKLLQAALDYLKKHQT